MRLIFDPCIAQPTAIDAARMLLLITTAAAANSHFTSYIGTVDAGIEYNAVGKLTAFYYPDMAAKTLEIVDVGKEVLTGKIKLRIVGATASEITPDTAIASGGP